VTRFFVNETDIRSSRVIISGGDAKHITKVLRLGRGDYITVSDGKGNDCLAGISKIMPDAVYAEIIGVMGGNTESPIEVCLFQGIPKADKMETIIQKSVELGVKSIVPVMTERTVVRFDNAGSAEKKASRWRKISLEAAKQCNRSIIPGVESPVNFADALELMRSFDLAVIPYENDKLNSLKSFIKKNINRRIARAAVMIGPEGGFSEEEIDKARSFNIETVTLGPRILRTETAGIAVIAILMYELGDIG